MGRWQGTTKVTYVRNITDVDDKINARAGQDYPDLPLNEAIRRVTEKTEAQFHADMAALGALDPTVEPRATEHIDQMKAMIEALIENGCAYVAEDHVLFDVAAMPDYGKLSGRSLDEMIAGARVEVAPYKRDPMDFVLWKPSKPGEPSWASPAGIAAPGRPGWHIECSAMADRWLWEEAKPKLSATGLSRPHTFDIHGGGIDLVFPHHENEIAQSRCAYGTEIMAQIWMHNGFLQVEGEKMAKSLGNFVTVHELLATSNSAVAIGLARRSDSPCLELITVSRSIGHSSVSMRRTRRCGSGMATSKGRAPRRGIPGPVMDALSDDLNTPKAIAEMHRLHSAGHWGGLRAALGFLGFSGERTKIRRSAPFVQDCSQDAANTVIAAHHARRRPPTGTTIIGVPMPFARDDEIKNRIAKRNAAREAKNFKEADRIRDELAAMGITLKDAKDPKTGELVTTWEVAR